MQVFYIIIFNFFCRFWGQNSVFFLYYLLPTECTRNEKVEKSFTSIHALDFKIARLKVISVGGNQIMNIIINFRLKTYKVMIKVPSWYISYSYSQVIAVGTYMNVVCLSVVFSYLKLCVCVWIFQDWLPGYFWFSSIALVLYCIFFFLFWNSRFAFHLLLSVDY